MFTNELIKWIIAFVLLTVVAIGGATVTGRVVAVDDELEMIKFDVEETGSTAHPDPNAFTSDLDSLRHMGQAETIRAIAGEAYKYADVYEYSSDLDALREKAVVSKANDFTTQLDHLRQTGQQATISSHLAGAVFDHTTDLDTLRAKAMAASLLDEHHPDVVSNDVKDAAP